MNIPRIHSAKELKRFKKMCIRNNTYNHPMGIIKKKCHCKYHSIPGTSHTCSWNFVGLGFPCWWKEEEFNSILKKYLFILVDID